MVKTICRDIYKGTTLSLLVLDRRSLELYQGNSSYIVISVTDPSSGMYSKDGEVSMKEDSLRKGILRLEFLDIQEPCGLSSFSKDHAKEIISFVKTSFVNTPFEEDLLLVVGCEMGISRSAAIAKAFDAYYNRIPNLQKRKLKKDHKGFFDTHYAPNDYIFCIMMEELHRKEDNGLEKTENVSSQ